jgi:Arc/MetJ-type ribon-helix-helix transcriptional regulator
MAEVHELRPKTPDSEKITVNLGFIDLGRVDLMVRDGFYANRADFIRTAIRNQLERQDDADSSSSGCRTIRGRILRRLAMPGRRSTSRFSASPPSPAMSRLNSPAPPSHPCRSSALSRPARP